MEHDPGHLERFQDEVTAVEELLGYGLDEIVQHRLALEYASREEMKITTAGHNAFWWHQAVDRQRFHGLPIENLGLHFDDPDESRIPFSGAALEEMVAYGHQVISGNYNAFLDDFAQQWHDA